MKRAKRIYILLGILAAACAATFIILRVEEKKEQIRNSDEIILEIAADSVEFLSWENEETSLSFHKEDSWVYDDDSAFPVDDEKIGELLARFESFSVSFIIEEVEDNGQYGLDSPELTVAVDYSYEDENGETVSDTFSLSVSRDPEEAKEAAEEAQAQTTDSSEEEEEITAYARVGESPIVYQIAGSGYEALMQYSYDDLRHSEVLTADFADITQLDITLEENQYTISSEETEEGRICSYNGQELDVTELESALNALTADSFTDEEPSQKEEISLTVHLDNENFPTVEIVLYRYDGEHCLAQVDGKSFALVSRSLAVDLIEAVNAIVLS